ncbi:hypothetical protein RB595_002009 [Gaeumannomyces hyphopodioides]
MSQAARPAPAGVVPNLEHPEDVLHTINFATQILSLIFVSSFTLMRLYAKIVISPPFYPDDWFSVLAWHGGGYHVWEITADNLIGFYKITLILMVTRVFATSRKTVMVGHAFIFLMLCYYLPVLIIKAQICRPIEGYWDDAVRSKCFNQRAVFIADTVMSALSDTAVLCLPIPIAMKLRMTWQKRLRVLVMLSAGGVATAFSIVRLVLVLHLQGSDDDPVDFVRFNLLGTAEISIGVICGCFPAVNILMRYQCPSPESSAQSSSSGPAVKFLFGSRLRTQRLATTRRADTTLGTATILEGDFIGRADGDDANRSPRQTSGLFQPEAVASPPHNHDRGRRGSELSSSALVAPEPPTIPPPRRRSILRQDRRRGSAPMAPHSPGSPAVRVSEDCIFPIERRLSLAAQRLEDGAGVNEGAAGRSATPLSPRAPLDGPGEGDPWYELVTSPTFDGPDWEIDVESQAGRLW